MSPDLLLELLSTEEGRADKAADLVLQIASRMTDETLGGFVATGVIAQGGASTRLAQAFQALVPDKDRRPACSRSRAPQVAQSPLGETEGFDDLWKNAADMLTSYSDEQFVSESYARKLSGGAHAGARSRARVRRSARAHRLVGLVGRRRRGPRAGSPAAARPADDRDRSRALEGRHESGR